MCTILTHKEKSKKGKRQMAHVEKFQMHQLAIMLGHYNRTNQNISNKNVDRSLSHLNYNLAPEHPGMTDFEFIKKRCSEVRCLNRDDVVKMVDWVITKPKDLDPEKEKDFFQECYNFLEKKYGKENVIAAWVHKDETTPHMHFSFVPVTIDKKKGDLKVSAKEILTKPDLKMFHPSLQRHLEEKLQCPVHVLNEATKEGNLAMDEYKRMKALQDYQEAKKLIEEAPERAAAIIREAEEKAKAIEKEYEAKKRICEAAREMNMIEGVKEVKTLSGKTKSYEVPAALWEAQISSREAQNVLTKEAEKQIESYKEIQKENFELKSENKRLRKENAKLKGIIEKIKEVFRDAPKRFTEALKSIFRGAEYKSITQDQNELKTKEKENFWEDNVK